MTNSSPRGTSIFSSRAMSAWKASSCTLPNASVTSSWGTSASVSPQANHRK